MKYIVIESPSVELEKIFNEYGFVGVTIWLTILDYLSQQPNYKLKLTGKIYKEISERLDLKSENYKLMKYLKGLSELGVYDSEQLGQGYLCTPALL